MYDGTLNIMIIVLFTISTCNALTIATVGNSDVTKREVNPHDLFPDWVPFKNKHGDDLGEFISVQRKKPKKRLARPSNFVMRAAGADEADYYDRGLEDSEDNYESKDWSDLHRPAITDSTSVSIDLNHTDLVDIEGIVHTVTQRAKILPTFDSPKLHMSHDSEQNGRRESKNSELNTPLKEFLNLTPNKEIKGRVPINQESRNKPTYQSNPGQQSNTRYLSNPGHLSNSGYPKNSGYHNNPDSDSYPGYNGDTEHKKQELKNQDPKVQDSFDRKTKRQNIENVNPEQLDQNLKVDHYKKKLQINTRDDTPINEKDIRDETTKISAPINNYRAEKHDESIDNSKKGEQTPIRVYDDEEYSEIIYSYPKNKYINKGHNKNSKEHHQILSKVPDETKISENVYDKVKIGSLNRSDEKSRERDGVLVKENKSEVQTILKEKRNENVQNSYRIPTVLFDEEEYGENIDDLTKQRNTKEKRDENSKQTDQIPEMKADDEEYEENVQDQMKNSSQKKKINDSKENNTPKVVKLDDEEEYDDSSGEKKEASSKEKQENEERKKRILSAVDILKERHAKEQRLLSEKLREEELERDNAPTIEHFNKYSLNNHKLSDFDDYDQQEKSFSFKDKYKLQPLRKIKQNISTTTTESSSTTTTPRPTVLAAKENISDDSDKISIFKNPRRYMMSEDDYMIQYPIRVSKYPETTTVSLDTLTVYTAGPNQNILPSDETVMPENMIPTYSQNKRVGKNRKKSNSKIYIKPQTTSTVAPVSSIMPESNTEPYVFSFGFPTNPNSMNTWTKDTNQTEPTRPSSNKTRYTFTPTFTKEQIAKQQTIASSSIEVSGENLSGTERNPFSEMNRMNSQLLNETNSTTSLSKNPCAASDWSKTTTTTTSPYSTACSTPLQSNENDTVAEGSKKAVSVVDSAAEFSEHPKDENKYFEKGGGKEGFEEHGESKEEHGKKAYEAIHKDTKTEKGHHDKETHHGDYKDRDGHDVHHHDEKKHYGIHNHEEHGNKYAKYEESGKHSKGHSTKGSHDIHKKDEYEKKVEFFEEDGDSEEEEYTGGHIHKRENSAGGSHRKGNLKAFDDHREGGEKGFFAKGGSEHIDQGHKSAAGHDSHGKRGSAHHGRGAKEAGKKWIYHHGYPAKTANLVVIDRREDIPYHGPSFYG